MPNLILIDRIFEIITNITEVTKLFKEKLNNEESINQAINEY